jgi:hypothetical protein
LYDDDFDRICVQFTIDPNQIHYISVRISMDAGSELKFKLWIPVNATDQPSFVVNTCSAKPIPPEVRYIAQAIEKATLEQARGHNEFMKKIGESVDRICSGADMSTLVLQQDKMNKELVSTMEKSMKKLLDDHAKRFQDVDLSRHEQEEEEEHGPPPTKSLKTKTRGRGKKY